MQAMVGRAMADGAFGLSSGLKYVPGAYAATEEVIALARVAGYFGGIYISHMREEGLQLLDAVRETIRIGEEGGLPTQITHHKVSFLTSPSKRVGWVASWKRRRVSSKKSMVVLTS